MDRISRPSASAPSTLPTAIAVVRWLFPLGTGTGVDVVDAAAAVLLAVVGLDWVDRVDAVEDDDDGVGLEVLLTEEVDDVVELAVLWASELNIETTSV